MRERDPTPSLIVIVSRSSPARIEVRTAQISSAISRPANGSTGQNPCSVKSPATPNVGVRDGGDEAVAAVFGVSEQRGDEFQHAHRDSLRYRRGGGPGACGAGSMTVLPWINDLR